MCAWCVPLLLAYTLEGNVVAREVGGEPAADVLSATGQPT
jgi:hypothetical protein